MPLGHMLNQHELPPVMSAGQVQDFVDTLRDALSEAFRTAKVDAAAAPAVLSDAQFAELKRLLEPGYELSKMYLDQHRAALVPPPSTPPVATGSFEPPLNGPDDTEPSLDWASNPPPPADVPARVVTPPEVDHSKG